MITRHLTALLVLGLFSTLSAADKPAETTTQPANCIVSDEPLGEMGKPYEYIHKEEGKPDRLVTFCCKRCVDRFKKNPAKYLAKLDAVPVAPAAVDAPAPASPAAEPAR